MEEVEEEVEEPEEKEPELHQPSSIFDAIFGDLFDEPEEEEKKDPEVEMYDFWISSVAENMKFRVQKEEEEEQMPETSQAHQERFVSVMELYSKDDYGPAPPPDLDQQDSEGRFYRKRAEPKNHRTPWASSLKVSVK